MFQKPFLILLSDCGRDIVISDCDCDIVSDCARFFDDDKRVYKSNKPVVSILISADSSSTPLRAFVLRSKLAHVTSFKSLKLDYSPRKLEYWTTDNGLLERAVSDLDVNVIN